MRQLFMYLLAFVAGALVYRRLRNDPQTAPRLAEFERRAQMTAEKAAETARLDPGQMRSKASEVVDTAAERARGVIDSAAGKAQSAIDAAAAKARETVDAAAEKGRQVVSPTQEGTATESKVA